MKKLLFSLCFLLTFTALMAQAPQRISYQSIIRDANNVVVASSAISVKISLLRGTATGPAVYVETHGITTNANGLVSLNIGEGTAITGTFAGIDWSNGPYLIQTAIDPTGGTDYSIIGTAPLNSVPYALNAANASVATTLAGTLPIASGGTGATTATTARAALGLENVDNTSDANKPVSTATQTALSTKEDKVNGKELSTNDYSTAEKAKLAAITGSNTGDQDLSTLATTAAVAQKANATDVTTSLATKVDKVTGKELSANDYTTAEKTKLAAITGTNTGDQDLSTLATTAAVATKASIAELATGLALKANVTEVTTSLATKVDKVTGKELSTNDYSTAEKAKLAAITGNNTGDQVNIAGNAATATKLQATVTINGIAFDGSSNVTIPATGAVPYTGATQGLDLGAYDLKVNGLTVGRGNGNIASNTAIGEGTLTSNTTGTDNIASGNYALYANTSGSFNIASGFTALGSNTTGDGNTASGYAALQSNTTGSANIASGNYALASNTTGVANLASGYLALYQNTTGANNTAVGDNSLSVNTTGVQNTTIGSRADVASAALINATALGYGANVAASNSIQLGNTNVTNVKTSGTLTAGAVTYPNTHGGANQVLTTTGTGALTWATPSGGVPYTGATQAVDLGAYDLKVNGLTVGRGNGNVDSNTASGNYTLASNTTGAYNTATGLGALYANTTGAANTATGYIALYNNTTGTDNTANGRGALYSNTTGAYNTATGFGALSNNTAGLYNTATGYVALASNTTGLANQASGNYALTGNTTGNYNTAAGYSALRANTTGSSNTASGYNALDANTTGTNNTAIGYYANVGSVALTNATAIGSGATVLASNTIQIGDAYVTDVITSGALTAGAVTYPNTHGAANQFLTTTGTGTLTWSTLSGGVPYTGAIQAVDLGAYDLKVNGLNMGKGGGSINNNTAFGNSSLGINSTGSVNTAAGFESLKSNTSGEANTAFGAYALRENQNGARNTAVGSQALQLTNGAYDNTAIGALSAVSNTTGNNNVAIGSKSLQSNTAGLDNIAVGFEALYLNQANGNTASGYQSMRQNIGGGRNTALGYTALYSNTTASFNVAVGAQALGGTTTGERNVAIGAGALDENRTGSYNTVLGGFAGRYIANGSSSALDGGSDGASPNTIMDNSILIGAWTKPKANNETNQIVIGYNAIGNGSNTIQLGNTGITNVKTSGTLTAGAVTYPNVDGSANQVLSTNGSGTLAWSTSNGLPTTGNIAGDMLYWNGSTNAWVKVAAGTDGQTLTFVGGKPVWTGTISYANTVVNATTGKIWMDRNLGASQVATSSTYDAAYGDLYQWGRGTDGHQIRTSGTTTTLSTTDAPGNGNFILEPNSPYDWRSPKEDNLWQGVSGVNNPCPTGYRIPTEAEWDAERLSWSTNNALGAFASPLKLPLAGFRDSSNGSLGPVGAYGYYWSSTVGSALARLLLFDSSIAFMHSSDRASGFSVRCIKN